MKKKAVVLIVIAGLALGAGYPASRWYAMRQHASDPAGDPILTAYGNVDIRQLDLAFRVDGRLQALHFEEGDRIEKGALVAELDPQPIAEEVALREAELNATRVVLQGFEGGYRSQEIETARATVAEREATLATLDAEYARRESLARDHVISQQAFDDSRARRDEAAARLESAREELALREEGFRAADIAQARAQVASREAQLRISRTRLDDTRLIAPSPGIMLTRVLEPGSIVGVGKTVVTLALNDPVWVRAYIPEPALGKIHPGMEALVFTDSRPDHPYRGQIGFISPEAEFTPKSVETPDLRTRLVYRFRVVVENPDDGLRQGMPVTVKLGAVAPPAPSHSSGTSGRSGEPRLAVEAER
jgi:HlyD family secretion protein